MDSYIPIFPAPGPREEATRRTLRALVEAQTEAAANFVYMPPLKTSASDLPDDIRRHMTILRWDIDSLIAETTKSAVKKQREAEAKKTKEKNGKNIQKKNKDPVTIEWLQQGRKILALIKIPHRAKRNATISVDSTKVPVASTPSTPASGRVTVVRGDAKVVPRG